MSTTKEFRINSFFAGIGGFDLGFERQGFKTSFMCEINPFCQDILKEHWPNIPLHSDITTLDSSKIPYADVWCGGFPCQDISLARASSERLGLKGTRSGLFFQFAELVEAKMPEVVIMENVEGLLSSNKGNDLGTILKRMTELGYAVAWRLLNSRYFGVPQSRSRIYICCWKDNLAKAVSTLFEDILVPKPTNPRLGFINPIENGTKFPQVPEVAYCLAATSGRHTGTDWSRTYVVCQNGVRRLTPLEYERLQGFPDFWTISPNYMSDSDDTDTLRYTAVGNAVSVPVIEWLANRIKSLLRQDVKRTSISQIIQTNPNFAKLVILDELVLDCSFDKHDSKFKWPNAGIAVGKTLLTASVPPCPSCPIKSQLIDLIEPNADLKYHLSPNAATGILRRVDRQGRSLFKPLRQALEKLQLNFASYE